MTWECASLLKHSPARFAALLACALIAVSARAQEVVVGSKMFTESYVLGEMARKLIQDEGLPVRHRQGMGATGILWEALKRGDIAIYPEYTGTLWQELLKSPSRLSMAEMRAQCEKIGIGITDPLGFDNTYALVMTEEKAKRLGIVTLSDLAKHSDLRAGPDPEFLGRKDGWQPMVERYGMKFASVKGIAHGLVYQAVARGDIDVTDCYSTDAQIAEFNLRVLEDDLQFFPSYKAVFLYRLNAPAKALDAIRKLEGQVDGKTMTELNALAEKGKDYTAAANHFFASRAEPTAPPPAKMESEGMWQRIWRHTQVHLSLVGIALLATILAGVPLGVIAARNRFAGGAILGLAGVIQTVPSIALLVMIVPLFGISQWTAILGLFLYGLLPIVRNTAAGLQSIPRGITESAQALGLEPSAQLTQIELPIASRTILAGIKTTAVITVGTATLAGLIGAGGYGEAILSGINLNDIGIMMEGALPAAALALLVQFLFEGLDRVLVPKGLRA